MAATITDILIIALLAGSIGYGVLISRKVQVLMATLQELEPLVREFSTAVDKSEVSVSQMRKTLEETGPAPAEQGDEDLDDEANATSENGPAFASRRVSQRRLPGVQVVRNKQDLVRRFFETSRTESRV